MLHEMITQRRYPAWSTALEKVMLLYIQLAVNQRQNARVAIQQYRNITAQHPASFERISLRYIALSEAKAAEVAAAEKLLEDDEENSVESFQTSSAIDSDVGFLPSEQIYFVLGVSGEDAEGTRAHRNLVVPWLRYTWEAYRSLLDIMKNNAKLDHVYHQVAAAALNFCVLYKRLTDFHRLGETLRGHLATIQKYQGQAHAVDLNIPDNVRAYLQTRFKQLDAARALDVWHEAYYIVEDIHQLMLIPQSDEALDSVLLEQFYVSLVDVFWQSENLLLHSYALRMLFKVLVDRLEDLEMEGRVPGASLITYISDVANQIALATLVTPKDSTVDYRQSVSHNGSHYSSKAEVLGSVLEFSENPSRAELVERISNDGILEFTSDAIRVLYNSIESIKGSLTAYRRLSPSIEVLSENAKFTKFVPWIEDLIVSKVIAKVSAVYEVMRIDSLMALLPHLSDSHLERIILNSETADVHLQVDHRSGLIRFNNAVVYSSKRRCELGCIANRLRNVSSLIPGAVDQLSERTTIFDWVRHGLEDEKDQVAARLVLLDRRKKEREQQLRQKAIDAARKDEEERHTREQEELERRKVEAERREKQKIADEARAALLAQKVALITSLKTKLENVSIEVRKHAENVFLMVESIKLIDLQKLKEELEADEIRETLRQHKEAFKRADYFIRACRIEERDLVVKSNEAMIRVQQDQLEIMRQKLIDERAAEREYFATEKKRFSRITSERDTLLNTVVDARRASFIISQQEQLARVAEAKAKWELAEEERLEKEKEAAKLAELEKKKREEADAWRPGTSGASRASVVPGNSVGVSSGSGGAWRPSKTLSSSGPPKNNFAPLEPVSTPFASAATATPTRASKSFEEQSFRRTEPFPETGRHPVTERKPVYQRGYMNEEKSFRRAEPPRPNNPPPVKETRDFRRKDPLPEPVAPVPKFRPAALRSGPSSMGPENTMDRPQGSSSGKDGWKPVGISDSSKAWRRK